MFAQYFKLTKIPAANSKWICYSLFIQIPCDSHSRFVVCFWKEFGIFFFCLCPISVGNIADGDLEQVLPQADTAMFSLLGDDRVNRVDGFSAFSLKLIF